MGLHCGTFSASVSRCASAADWLKQRRVLFNDAGKRRPIWLHVRNSAELGTPLDSAGRCCGFPSWIEKLRLQDLITDGIGCPRAASAGRFADGVLTTDPTSITMSPAPRKGAEGMEMADFVNQLDALWIKVKTTAGFCVESLDDVENYLKKGKGYTDRAYYMAEFSGSALLRSLLTGC